jgi:hypothetical protein
MKNRTFGPCLAAIHRILISVVGHLSGQRRVPAPCPLRAGFFLPAYASHFKRHLQRLAALWESGDLNVAMDTARFVGLEQVRVPERAKPSCLSTLAVLPSTSV